MVRASNSESDFELRLRVIYGNITKGVILGHFLDTKRAIQKLASTE